MIRLIDSILNYFTMYRVVLYCLIIIFCFTLVFSFFQLLPYTPAQLILSLLIILITCYLSNIIFQKFFKSIPNQESYLITGFILFFIFNPPSSAVDVVPLILAGALSIASKYIFAVGKKHLFNPAAAAALLLSFNPDTASTWWIASKVMFPVVLVLGLLTVRKIRRFSLFFSFVVVSLSSSSLFAYTKNSFSLGFLAELVTSWPLLFLGTIMLTEPLTMPPTRMKQIIYGAIVGILYSAQFRIGPLFSTPELALCLGNIYSYFAGSKVKLFLPLIKMQKIATDVYDFEFLNRQKFNFKSGQYLEWTLSPKNNDSRGNRRYFTIASSPSEKNVRLGVKIQANSSSFKRKLLNLKKGELVVATQLAGDFVLPENNNEKIVFLAGGIGVTPFRSMIKYLIDTEEKRDIILLYFNKSADEIVYRQIFAEAEKKIGLKVEYVLTGKNIAKNWTGKVGRLSEEMLYELAPDFKKRIFYLSGPNAFVDNYKEFLLRLDLSPKQIVTDYFPGF